MHVTRTFTADTERDINSIKLEIYIYIYIESVSQSHSGKPLMKEGRRRRRSLFFIANNFVSWHQHDGVGKAITTAIMGTIQSESLVLIFSQAENNLHLRY